MKFATTDSETRSLFQDAVRYMVSNLGAERALVLFGDPQLTPRAAHGFVADRVFVDGLLSTSILDQVKADGQPLLILDAQKEPRLRDIMSIVLTQLRSVLCVPLKEPGSDEVVGLLYSDSPNQTGLFDELHMTQLQDYAGRLQHCLVTGERMKKHFDSQETRRPVRAQRSSQGEVNRSAFDLARRRTVERTPVAPDPLPMVPRRQAARAVQAPLGRPSKRSLALFFRSLAAMVNAGLPINRGLAILSQHDQDQAMAALCAHLEQHLMQGNTLSSGLSQAPHAFSTFHIHMVHSAENSGQLPRVLESLADFEEKTERTQMKVKSALTYPMFLLLASSLMMVLGPPYLLRGQMQIIRSSGVEIPTLTRLFLLASDCALNPIFWAAAGAALVAGTLGARKLLATVPGRRWAQSRLLQSPLVGPTYRTFTSARFARALALQLRSGVMLNRALPIAANCSDDEVLKSQVSLALEALNQGSTLPDSLERCEFFPPLLIALTRIGMEAGAPAELMEWVADFFDQQVEASVERATALLEPIIMAVMGTMVAIILVATMLPMIKVIQVL